MNITAEEFLAYVLDKPVCPVVQQWLDQQRAAIQDARAVLGVNGDHDATIPSKRAQDLAAAMWSRVITESERDRCDHLRDRPL